MVKNIIKYIISLALGVGLLWYLVSNQSPEGKENIIKGFLNANYSWIFLTIVIALFEKVVRAYRWNLLMEPLSYKPFLKNTAIAVMIAYFANIFAPRMGEIARCGMLKKSDDVPMNVAFGTVVSERIVDLVSLLIIIPLALLLEYQKISELLIRSLDKINETVSDLYWILAILGIIGIIGCLILFIYRNSLKKNVLYLKIHDFVLGMLTSLLSIRKMEKKGQFIVCTIVIWTCYFLMTYLAFFSLDATKGLDLSAGLVILVVGGLGMAAPVQAGMGAYHGIVKETLEQVYMISDQWALPYAFLVWGSQTLTAFAAGLVCLIIVFLFSKKPKENLQSANV